MNPCIEVRNLKKYFDTPSGQLHAVDDISFKIEKGTTMGVVGEMCIRDSGNTLAILLSNCMLYNKTNLKK